MMRITVFLITLFLLNQSFIAWGQDNKAKSDNERTDWWDDIDGFLNHQSAISLNLATEALSLNPPSLTETRERKMALLLIDNVMHLEKAPLYPSVQKFLRDRFNIAVNEICSEKVVKGAVIWKLYNHAFVVKTASVTIGFDIQRGIRGIEGFQPRDEDVDKLLEQVDILFISHLHSDHADDRVARKMLEMKKPVVSPPDIWKDLDIYSRVMHPERDPSGLNEIRLPSTGKMLRVVVYPGHQGERILNNVYLVITPEDLVFSHTGDQSNLADFEWIDKIKDQYKVDIVMTNSWSVYPEQRLARGYDPGLIIPGHENELGHTIDHREPYWLNYPRLPERSAFPWIQMVWGEKFHYVPGGL